MSIAPPDPLHTTRSGSEPTREPATRGDTEREPTKKTRVPRSKRHSVLGAVKAWLRGAFFDNGPIKLVSLVLAITVYILVNTDKEAVIGVYVGVSYTMPEDRVLVSEKVDRVRITVKGSWRRTRRFDERSLDRIHVDLTNMRSGEFAFQEDMIHLPAGLQLLSINPATMRVEFEKRSSKSVPVSIKTTGRPARGYKVDRKTANPSHVTVRGAESVVAAMSEVRTVAIPLDGRRDPLRETVSLVPPEQYAEIVDQRHVEVDITFVEELEKRTIGPLPVAVLSETGAPAPGLVTVPDEVTVILHGSSVAIEDVLKAGVNPYVRVLPDDVASGRSVEVLLDVEGAGHEVKPREVKVRKK